MDITSVHYWHWHRYEQTRNNPTKDFLDPNPNATVLQLALYHSYWPTSTAEWSHFVCLFHFPIPAHMAMFLAHGHRTKKKKSQFREQVLTVLFGNKQNQLTNLKHFEMSFRDNLKTPFCWIQLFQCEKLFHFLHFFFWFYKTKANFFFI